MSMRMLLAGADLEEDLDHGLVIVRCRIPQVVEKGDECLVV